MAIERDPPTAASDESLPLLRAEHNRLATDAARVVRFVDGLMDATTEIVASVAKSDWGETRRLSGFLAIAADVYGLRVLSETARVVLRMDQSVPEMERKRAVLKLVGAAGRARRPIGR